MEGGRTQISAALQEPFRAARAAAVDAWIGREGLVSIVLFGSVARREARSNSDVDVLLVAEGLPRQHADRRQPFLDTWEAARTARVLGPEARLPLGRHR